MKSQGCSGMLPLAPNRPVNHFPCLFHLRSPPVKFGVHLVRDVSPGLSSNLNSQSDEGGVKSSCEQAGNKVKPSEWGGAGSPAALRPSQRDSGPRHGPRILQSTSRSTCQSPFPKTPRRCGCSLNNHGFLRVWCLFETPPTTAWLVLQVEFVGFFIDTRDAGRGRSQLRS